MKYTITKIMRLKVDTIYTNAEKAINEKTAEDFWEMALEAPEMKLIRYYELPYTIEGLDGQKT